MNTLPPFTELKDIPPDETLYWSENLKTGVKLNDKKTIFLTGANGFVGRHLLPKLLDYNVICGGYNELPSFIPDYIIHLAAVTTTSDSFIPIQAFMRWKGLASV